MKLETALAIQKAILEGERHDYGFTDAKIQWIDSNETEHYEIIIDLKGLFKEHIQMLLEILKGYPKVSFRFKEYDRLVIYHEG